MAKIKKVDQIPSAKDYLERIGAKVTSMLRAEIEGGEEGGYKKATIRIAFDKAGEVRLHPRRIDLEPTAEERASMKADFAKVEFMPTTTTLSVGDQFKKLDEDHLFVCRDRTGKKIHAVQVRYDRPDGKDYITYCPMEDGSWEITEPEEGLPLWGMEHLRTGKPVMLHEGAKAAQGALRSSKDKSHPFYECLSAYTHVGWIGGATRPFATNWRTLDGFIDIIIVPDHDDPGYNAVRGISRGLPKSCLPFAVQWPHDMKSGFDCANPVEDIPAKLIRENWQLTDNRYPAVWATSKIWNDDPEAKPTFKIRDTFGYLWSYVANNDLFILRLNPTNRYTADQFDNRFRKFSDVKKLSELMKNAASVEVYDGLTYIPGSKKGTGVSDPNRPFIRNINVYTPSRIHPRDGSVKPWLDFLDYLFPNKEPMPDSNELEVEHVKKFCATLIAKPENRPQHGMLLVSKTQGTGKGTLIEILEACVGRHNSSSPSASQIVDAQFNGFLGFKTLVSCGEIYEGHSWKAYNKMKAWITDVTVSVNEKHLKMEDVPAFAWFIICSNDKSALKMDEKDRRWFIPNVTEDRAPKEYFDELRLWLNSGGYGKIIRWAKEFENYLTPGYRVPMTTSKEEMISTSENDEVLIAQDLLKRISEDRVSKGKPPYFFFEMGQLRNFAQNDVDAKDRLAPNIFSQRLCRHETINTIPSMVYIRSVGKPLRGALYGLDPKQIENTKLQEFHVNLNDFNKPFDK